MTVFGADDLKITGLTGLTYTLSSAQDEVDRLDHRVRGLERQLEHHNNRTDERRLRRRLAQVEAEHDHLWRQLHPVASNDGSHGGLYDPAQFRRCRSADCSNEIHKSISSQTIGFCPPCFERATHPQPERT